MRSSRGWARRFGHWSPYLRHYNYRADLDLLLLDQAEACPDALILGASQSGRSLTPANLRGKDLGGGIHIDRPFTFAIAGERATTMFEIWLAVLDRGCIPEVIFVEANPIVLNAAKGGVIHDAPFVNLRTSLRLPDGFAASRGYDFARQADLWTNERLLIHRKRDRIVQAYQAQFGWRGAFDLGPDPGKKTKKKKEPKPWTKDLPFDGQTGKAPNRSLRGKAWKKEKRKRLRMLKRKKLVYRYGPVEAAALLLLVEDAQEHGTRVILHTPPVTGLYPEILLAVDPEDNWGRFASELRSTHGDIWFDAWRDDDRYPHKLFHDYVHLNRKGSRRYANDLVEAAKEVTRPKGQED